MPPTASTANTIRSIDQKAQLQWSGSNRISRFFWSLDLQNIGSYGFKKLRDPSGGSHP